MGLTDKANPQQKYDLLWMGVDVGSTTVKVVVCDEIRTGSHSSRGTFMNSATEDTRREYQTVAVTVTGPGGRSSGDQVYVSETAWSGASR